MFGKLLSLLSSVKGAAAASVLATATLGGATLVVNDDARQAVENASENVAQNVAQVVGATPKPSDEGKPVVVAARNDADKKLRDAFREDHKRLEKLHSTQVDGTDRQKLEQTVNDADKKLRERLDKALDAVGALTLGREGRESESPTPTPSPKASPDIHAVVVDQAKVDAIVTAAIADMKKIVDDAEKAVAALPTFKPGEQAKPNEQKAAETGKANEAKPSERGKPSESPKK